MQRWCLTVVAALVAATGAIAQAALTLDTATFGKAGREFNQSDWKAVDGGEELKALARFNLGSGPVDKRFVIRMPAKWNGSLVIGAHGGSGGDAIDRAGKVYATSETAL